MPNLRLFSINAPCKQLYKLFAEDIGKVVFDIYVEREDIGDDYTPVFLPLCRKVENVDDTLSKCGVKSGASFLAKQNKDVMREDHGYYKKVRDYAFPVLQEEVFDDIEDDEDAKDLLDNAAIAAVVEAEKAKTRKIEEDKLNKQRGISKYQ